MFDKKRRTPIDPDLQVIATLERAMVRIAVLLAEGLRAELAARRQQR
jgi:hypothetical protein